MAGQPGSFQPRNEDWMVRELQDIKSRMQRLEAANVFGLTRIAPKDGGTDLDGFVNVNGPLGVTGDADFTGNMRISGTLDLPAGIIGNDALANPVTAAVTSGDANGFAVPSGSTPAEVITRTFTVPAGFTQALVMANADMTAANSTAAADYLFIQLKIDGVRPTYRPGGYTPPGAVGFVSSSYSRLLTSLGSTFTVTVEAIAGLAPWAANPDDNTANLNAMVTFLR